MITPVPQVRARSTKIVGPSRAVVYFFPPSRRSLFDVSCHRLLVMLVAGSLEWVTLDPHSQPRRRVVRVINRVVVVFS